MKLWIIQWSLNPHSKTSLVVNKALDYCTDHSIDHEYIDLREITMPFVDGRDLKAYDNQQLLDVYEQLTSCSHYLIGMPVYQYSVSWPLKNFLDLVVEAMEYKPFGMIATSGGVRSYMAAKDLMNVIFFEAWGIPVAPLVHSRSGDFTDWVMTNSKVEEKLHELLERLQKVNVAN